MIPEQAGKVTGLRIDIAKHEVNIEGDTKEVLTRLVAQYEKLFGAASREVCRDAVRPLLSQVPHPPTGGRDSVCIKVGGSWISY